MAEINGGFGMFIVFLEYSLLYVLSYWAVFLLFTEFFASLKWPRLAAAARTIGAVVGFLMIGFILVRLIPDEWWGNRVQHALCGGATAFYMCYRIICDADLRLTRFQTVIICCFTVTALGVANELAEFVEQALFDVVLSPTTVDTWLDLWSNTAGIGASVLVFMAADKVSRNRLISRIAAPGKLSAARGAA